MHFPEERFGASQSAALCLVTILTFVLSFAGLGFGPDLSDHEAIIGQGARETLQSGDWLIPRVNGEIFVRKPPLPIWLATWVSHFADDGTAEHGVSLLAARLPSAAAGWLTALVVYFLGRSLYGPGIAMVSALVMASCAGGLMFSHRAEVEMTLTLFSACTFGAFWAATETRNRIRRGWLIGFYLFLAMAMFAKAPLPLAAVMLPLAVWWFVTIPLLQRATDQVTVAKGVTAQLRRFLTLLSIPGILVFLAIVLPWPFYIYKHVDHALDLWRLEFVARYTGDMSEKAEPFWYYLPMVFLLALPYCLSLPEAAASPFLQSYRPIRRPLAFAWTWLIVHFVFVSTGAYKRSHYLATCLPAVALLLGPTLHRLFFAARALPRRAVAAMTLGFALIAVIGAAVAGMLIYKMVPDLTRPGIGVAVIAGLGIATACHFFYHGRRAVSFMTLVVMSGALFAWGWVGIGATGWLDYKPREMARAIVQAGIPTADRITWAVGRPDPRLAWHLGRPVPPLFSAMEMASMRTDRKKASDELQFKIANRIAARLTSQTPEYLVIDVKYWKLFSSFFKTPAHVVHRLHDPFDDDDGDDWMLVTNAWNMGEATSRPASQSAEAPGAPAH